MSRTVRPKKKARLQAKLTEELHNWAHDYASRKNTTVTQLIVDHFTALREKDHVGDRARR